MKLCPNEFIASCITVYIVCELFHYSAHCRELSAKEQTALCTQLRPLTLNINVCIYVDDYDPGYMASRLTKIVFHFSHFPTRIMSGKHPSLSHRSLPRCAKDVAVHYIVALGTHEHDSPLIIR